MSLWVFIGLVLLQVIARATSFEGLVLENNSSNGVRRAQVRILSVEPGADPRETETDESGRFRVSGLRQGTYWVEIVKPNHLKTVARVIWKEPPGDEQNVSARRIFRLIRYGVIAGRVSGTESLASGIHVVALHRPLPEYPWEPVDTGQTLDRNGTFRIHDLPPGVYQVGAYGFETSGMVMVPGDTVILNGEEWDNRNLRPPAESSATIRGHVLAEDYTNGAVMLVDLDYPQVGLAIRPTKQDGEFSFERVSPGVYRILSMHLNDRAERRFGSATVVVGESNPNGVEILTDSGGQITLRIDSTSTNASCRGTARATVAPLDWHRSFGVNFRDLTKRGSLAFASLAPGRYTVAADSEGGHCQNRTPRWIDVSTPLPHQEQGLTLAPLGSISGHITSNDPSRGHFVILLPFDQSAVEATVLVREPDAEGSFSFEGLPTGRYYVMLRQSGEPDGLWRPVVGLDPSMIEILPGTRANVDLSDAGEPFR